MEFLEPFLPKQVQDQGVRLDRNKEEDAMLGLLLLLLLLLLLVLQFVCLFVFLQYVMSQRLLLVLLGSFLYWSGRSN